MTLNVKIGIVIAVAILITAVVGGVWYVSMKPAVSNNSADNSQAGKNTDNSQPGPVLKTSASDNSDQSLTSDMASLDAQMKGLDSDSTTIDNNLKDQ